MLGPATPDGRLQVVVTNTLAAEVQLAEVEEVEAFKRTKWTAEQVRRQWPTLTTAVSPTIATVRSGASFDAWP